MPHSALAAARTTRAGQEHPFATAIGGGAVGPQGAPGGLWASRVVTGLIGPGSRTAVPCPADEWWGLASGISDRSDHSSSCAGRSTTIQTGAAAAARQPV
jgi:hypothetical protein